ncbi:hypothetical protein AV530_002957 [Patagioenas fasciata monilis]|uniref:Uncharacterized protein n=1 Tax=Patagioenas fasciata monilis TaxID=372326 RepID=A0A1V4L052_PATFA|nr:hypothetical protein AV530_002957 [Patagioenas fasciata monilis]
MGHSNGHGPGELEVSPQDWKSHGEQVEHLFSHGEPFDSFTDHHQPIRTTINAYKSGARLSMSPAPAGP